MADPHHLQTIMDLNLVPPDKKAVINYNGELHPLMVFIYNSLD